MDVREVKKDKHYRFMQPNGVSKIVKVYATAENEIHVQVTDKGSSENGARKSFNRIECERYISEIAGYDYSETNEAIEFAEWIRDNCVFDGAPKILYRETGERKTTSELFSIWKDKER